MSIIPLAKSAFAKDFKKILSISDEQAKKIENFVKETGVLKPNEKELESLIIDKDLDMKFIEVIFDVIEYLYSNSLFIKFNNQQIIDELAQLCKEENIKYFKNREEFIRSITSKIEKANNFIYNEAIYKHGAYFLRDMHYSVDIRPLIVEDKMEMFPIITTEFLLDNRSDEEKSIYINFNERTFNTFLDKIDDIKDELIKIKDYLNSKLGST